MCKGEGVPVALGVYDPPSEKPQQHREAHLCKGPVYIVDESRAKMETTLPFTISEVLAELQHELQELYGERLARTVLFGSHARGEGRADSDVDVLVVLQGPLNTYEEIKRLVPIAMDLWERYGLDVQLTPFSAERYADDRHPLVMNVRREGRTLIP